MTEVMIDHADTDEWTEITQNLIAPRRAPDVPVPERRRTLDQPRDEMKCCCWRCRGRTISRSEKGPMDRILARHLLRMSGPERNDWLRLWGAIPAHSPEDVRTIEAWIAIESGQRVQEPTYATKGGQ